jgi:hypothetical protein
MDGTLPIISNQDKRYTINIIKSKQKGSISETNGAESVGLGEIKRLQPFTSPARTALSALAHLFQTGIRCDIDID